MSKSTPSFKFYPHDWLVGTASMGLRARGLFITLIAHSWCQGATALPSPDTPANITELCRITGLTRSEWRRVWPEVSAKFTIRDDGRMVNPKLESIRQMQDEYRARQLQSGTKGGQATKAMWATLKSKSPPTGGKLKRMQDANNEFTSRRRNR